MLKLLESSIHRAHGSVLHLFMLINLALSGSQWHLREHRNGVVLLENIARPVDFSESELEQVDFLSVFLQLLLFLLVLQLKRLNQLLLFLLIGLSF